MKKLLVLVVLALGATTAVAAPTPDTVKQECRDALNNDPDFAKAIADKFNLQIEQRTLDAQVAADARIKKNEAHVIYAYAAMWVLAALFVIFLFMRQQALKREIATLRKDLEAAAK
jgi:hypothetical protein